MVKRTSGGRDRRYKEPCSPSDRIQIQSSTDLEDNKIIINNIFFFDHQNTTDSSKNHQNVWYRDFNQTAAAKSLQSCPTLCDPIDGSPPGFPVPGILRARTLEWVAISFSNAWKWKWSRSVVSGSSKPLKGWVQSKRGAGASDALKGTWTLRAPCHMPHQPCIAIRLLTYILQ